MMREELLPGRKGSGKAQGLRPKRQIITDDDALGQGLLTRTCTEKFRYFRRGKSDRGYWPRSQGSRKTGLGRISDQRARRDRFIFRCGQPDDNSLNGVIVHFEAECGLPESGK